MPVKPYICSILVSKYFSSMFIRCPFIKSTKRWPNIFFDIGWLTICFNWWAKTLKPTVCNYVWPIGIMMLNQPHVSTLDQQYCTQNENIDLKNDCYLNHSISHIFFSSICLCFIYFFFIYALHSFCQTGIRSVRYVNIICSILKMKHKKIWPLFFIFFDKWMSKWLCLC